MKCGECSFCKYDNSIKEFVCSIEPDLPIVLKDGEINCKKANSIYEKEENIVVKNDGVRIHMNQDKNNAFVSVGDVVRITMKNGKSYEGEILCIDIKKEGDALHPIMDIKGTSEDGENWADCFWVENMAGLEIVSFKGENTHGKKTGK